MSFEIEGYVEATSRIIARGPITAQTPVQLEALLKSHASDQITHIFFSSTGGSLGAALEVGRIIRRYRLVAIVDQEEQCTSACAYAFLGGIARHLSYESGVKITNQKNIGFHSFAYDLRVPGTLRGRGASSFADQVAQNSQVTTGGLADYVAVMGVNVDLIRQAAPYGRGSYLFLSEAELKRLGVLTDFERDLGDFKLVPDIGGLQAVFVHEDHQFILTCHAIAGGAVSPVLVFSQRFGQSPDKARENIQVSKKLSSILSGVRHDWVGRDFEHRHFHAHAWIVGTTWNPVFGFIGMTPSREDADEEYIALTSTNSVFFSEESMFHAMVGLSRSMVRELLSADELHFELVENQLDSGWGHKFDNKPRDREVIAYALQSCLPR